METPYLEAQLIEYLWRILQFSRSQIRRCLKQRSIAWLHQTVQQNPMGLISELKIQSKVAKPKEVAWGLHTPSSENYLTSLHNFYPERLRHLSDPPCVLYYRGNLDLLSHTGPRITLVGTRQASLYAKKVCEKLLEELAPWDPLILSGMATGVDSMVHTQALKLGIKTIGVLGTSLNRPYPSFHQKLFSEMEQKALLITEVYPEAPMGPWRFPERNRLLAALADGTVVVEAPEQSGSLGTAREALELGREVFIVPGPLIPDRNRGGHRLIQEGGHLLTHGEEILQILGATPSKAPPSYEEENEVYSKEIKENNQVISNIYKQNPEAVSLLNLLKEEPMQIDKMIHFSQKPASLVSTLLMDLTLEGLVEELPGGYFQLSHSF